MNELELIESERDVGEQVELRSADEVKLLYGSLRDSNGSSASRFVECGDAFRTFELFDEALECYGEGIARDSRCLQAYVGRGELLFELAVCGRTDEEILRLGWRSVDDFRKALVLSLGANDVVWQLAIALLLVDDAAGAQALADKVLMKGHSIATAIRCDFLYLSGLAMVFKNEQFGADEVFEELVGLESGMEWGWFGKLVSCLAVSDGATAEVLLRQLELRDLALWEAGLRLQRSGCRRFVSVAKALLEGAMLLYRKKQCGEFTGGAETSSEDSGQRCNTKAQ
jgi:hypothetical protein